MLSLLSQSVNSKFLKWPKWCNHCKEWTTNWMTSVDMRADRQTDSLITILSVCSPFLVQGRHSFQRIWAKFGMHTPVRCLLTPSGRLLGDFAEGPRDATDHGCYPIRCKLTGSELVVFYDCGLRGRPLHRQQCACTSYGQRYWDAAIAPPSTSVQVSR